jgi:pyridoxal phosphate phosphatase PHOSPHO2
MVPGVLDSIETLKRLGAELVVVSDANSFFITHVLEHVGVLPRFSEIITNPAHFDEKGQLSISPYHNNLECHLSSRNLCKGKVLQDYIAKRAKEGTKFLFVGYCGDGINDFCPMVSALAVLGVGGIVGRSCT